MWKRGSVRNSPRNPSYLLLTGDSSFFTYHDLFYYLVNYGVVVEALFQRPDQFNDGAIGILDQDKMVGLTQGDRGISH